MNTGDRIVISEREIERAVVIDKVINLIDHYTDTTFLPDGSVIDIINDVEGLRVNVEALK